MKTGILIRRPRIESRPTAYCLRSRILIDHWRIGREKGRLVIDRRHFDHKGLNRRFIGAAVFQPAIIPNQDPDTGGAPSIIRTATAKENTPCALAAGVKVSVPDALMLGPNLMPLAIC